MFQKGSADEGARSPSGFYGWHMLALASIVGILTGPGQSAAVSVFREHLSSGLDLSDSAIATAYLVGTLTSSAFQPRIGTWVDNIGVKRATIIIGVLFAIAVAHMSMIHGVIWLAVGFLGIRILGQGALSLTSTVAVAHWFNLRRGFAMGLKTTVTFSGMSAVPLILALTIEAWGWRQAWLIAAVTILLTIAPIAFFGYVDRPADLGQVPDGGNYKSKIVSNQRAKSVTRDAAIRTRTFWTLASVTICSSLFGTGLIFHQSNILGEIGYSNSEAAAMFLPTAVGSIVGGLGFGWLADRSIRPWLPGTSAFLIAATTFLGGSVTSFGGVISYVLLFGLAMGGVASMNTALLPALFGVGHIGSITGSLSFLSVLASSIGALAYSLGSNVFGDYRSTSVAFTLVPLLVSGLALTNRRYFITEKFTAP
jgi:MFS family permease